MKKQDLDKTEVIVSSMLKIYDFLKMKGVQDPGGEELKFLHLNNYPMDDEQKKVRELMDNVLKIIKTHNPELSEGSIYECLLFDLTQKAIWFPKDYPNVQSEYRKLSSNLLTYMAKREIDIPLVNLEVGERPIKFGLVTFFQIGESDKKGEWWETLKSTAGTYTVRDILSFARINCPGDASKALEYAIDVIGEMLTILRAVGFPLISKPNLHFGLVNEYQLFQTRPYRLGPVNESFRLSYQPQIVRRLGPGVAICQLKKDILDSIEISNLNKLQGIIESDFANPQTQMSRKLFLGLHWLGEATKPDTKEARFAKLVFALEALIGGDAGDKTGNLSTRGLTATLAERCAFLVGKSQSERKEVHNRIYEYYGIRSGIVHGGDKEIAEEQLADFAMLIRNTFWAILKKVNIVKNISDLQTWILDQRYSLPTLES
jgi:hypothetical protein